MQKYLFIFLSKFSVIKLDTINLVNYNKKIYYVGFQFVYYSCLAYFFLSKATPLLVLLVFYHNLIRR